MTLLLMAILSGVVSTSCSSDDNDEPKAQSIVGKWELYESYEEDDETGSIQMVLTFNSDYTGSIDETWRYQSRASQVENYHMDFNWSTTTNSNGSDILKISYVSGDKETELFPGYSTTVLWTREYVLTGKILNIYGGDGVWVFNRK